MIYPNLKKIEVPFEQFTYAVLLFGGGDLTCTLVTKDIWESWSDQEDATQFTDNIPNQLKIGFDEVHQMVNFCAEHGIQLADSVVDHAY